MAGDKKSEGVRIFAAGVKARSHVLQNVKVACTPQDPRTGDYWKPKEDDPGVNDAAKERAKDLMRHFGYPHEGGRSDQEAQEKKQNLQNKWSQEFEAITASVEIFYDETLATEAEIQQLLKERTKPHHNRKRTTTEQQELARLAAISAGVVMVHDDVIWTDSKFDVLQGKRQPERRVKVLDVSAPILSEHGDAGIAHRAMFFTNGAFDREKYKAHTKYLIRQWLVAANAAGVNVPIFTGEGEGVFSKGVPGIPALRAQCFREVLEDQAFTARLSNITSIVFSKINTDPPKLNTGYQAYESVLGSYNGTLPLLLTNREQAEIARDLPADLTPGLFAAGHPIQPPGNYWGMNNYQGQEDVSKAQDETLAKRVFWHVGVLDPRINEELAGTKLRQHLHKIPPQGAEKNKIAEALGVKAKVPVKQPKKEQKPPARKDKKQSPHATPDEKAVKRAEQGIAGFLGATSEEEAVVALATSRSMLLEPAQQITLLNLFLQIEKQHNPHFSRKSGAESGADFRTFKQIEAIVKSLGEGKEIAAERIRFLQKTAENAALQTYGISHVARAVLKFINQKSPKASWPNQSDAAIATHGDGNCFFHSMYGFYIEGVGLVDPLASMRRAALIKKLQAAEAKGDDIIFVPNPADDDTTLECDIDELLENARSGSDLTTENIQVALSESGATEIQNLKIYTSPNATQQTHDFIPCYRDSPLSALEIVNPGQNHFERIDQELQEELGARETERAKTPAKKKVKFAEELEEHEPGSPAQAKPIPPKGAAIKQAPDTAVPVTPPAASAPSAPASPPPAPAPVSPPPAPAAPTPASPAAVAKTAEEQKALAQKNAELAQRSELQAKQYALNQQRKELEERKDATQEKLERTTSAITAAQTAYEKIDAGYRPDAQGKTARSPWPSVAAGGGSMLAAVAVGIGLAFLMAPIAAILVAALIPALLVGGSYHRYHSNCNNAVNLTASEKRLKSEKTELEGELRTIGTELSQNKTAREEVDQKMAELPTHAASVMQAAGRGQGIG